MSGRAAMLGGRWSERGRERLRAIITAVVPEAAALSEPEWRDAEAIIGRALSTRAPAIRRQIRLFLWVLDAVSLVTHGHRLATLSANDRTGLLESLSRSKMLIVRRGVWGLRTLALMGYYARPQAALAIGYRASPAGWSARPDARPAAR
jgi:hypothetical protein